MKSVVITGASRGLGQCFVRKYLKDGYLVFAGVRDENAVALQNMKKEYQDTLVFLSLEVTDTESVNRAAKKVGEYTKQLDLLINNAAIHNATSFEELETADIDDCLGVYDVNSLGPLRVVKAFLPLLRNCSGAKVINISSESGSIGACRRQKEFDYCMSKAALNMASKLLSNYLKKDHILVLSLHPGWMRTDMGGANADLDPYETACQLAKVIDDAKEDNSVFIDNRGQAMPW